MCLDTLPATTLLYPSCNYKTRTDLHIFLVSLPRHTYVLDGKLTSQQGSWKADSMGPAGSDHRLYHADIPYLSPPHTNTVISYTVDIAQACFYRTTRYWFLQPYDYGQRYMTFSLVPPTTHPLYTGGSYSW